MNKKIPSILIIINLLLIISMMYFKYSIIFVTPLITNLTIFLIILTLIFLIVYGILISKESKEIYLFLIPSMIFVFLVRSIPQLVVSYPPLHDGYFYNVCAISILNYGTTTSSFLSDWYSLVGYQLQWPLMEILNANLFYMTNIDFMALFRFQEPFLGVLFFLGVFILARVGTENDKVSLIAALIASLCDSVIFYQAEFHPQGFAFVLFAFLLYSFIKSRSTKNIKFNLILIIISGAFVLSHHFSSLFLAIICILYIGLTKILSVVPHIKKQFKEVADDVTYDMSFFIFIIVLSLAHNFYVKVSPVMNYLLRTIDTTPNKTLITIGSTVPLYVTILASFKWITLGLALISVVLIYKTKKLNEIRLAILLLCILLAGLIGQFIIAGPIDRFLGFYIVMASIFASLTLYRWLKIDIPTFLSKNQKILTISALISIILVAGVFNSQTPSYFFKDSGVDTYYYYSNVLPEMEQTVTAGLWMNYTISPELKNISTFGSEFDTITSVFYFAGVPYLNMKAGFDDEKSYQQILKFNYLLINPNIPYEYSNKTEYDSFDRIYDNYIYVYKNVG